MGRSYVLVSPPSPAAESSQHLPDNQRVFQHMLQDNRLPSLPSSQPPPPLHIQIHPLQHLHFIGIVPRQLNLPYVLRWNLHCRLLVSSPPPLPLDHFLFLRDVMHVLLAQFHLLVSLLYRLLYRLFYRFNNTHSFIISSYTPPHTHKHSYLYAMYAIYIYIYMIYDIYYLSGSTSCQSMWNTCSPGFTLVGTDCVPCPRNTYCVNGQCWGGWRAGPSGTLRGVLNVTLGCNPCPRGTFTSLTGAVACTASHMDVCPPATGGPRNRTKVLHFPCQKHMILLIFLYLTNILYI